MKNIDKLPVRMQQECKRALQEGIKKNVETLCCFHCYSFKHIASAVGDFGGVGVPDCVPYDEDKPYVLWHCHPSSDPFSYTDVFTFFYQTNEQVMYAHGFDGTLYIMRKLPDSKQLTPANRKLPMTIDNFYTQYKSSHDACIPLAHLMGWEYEWEPPPLD